MHPLVKVLLIVSACCVAFLLAAVGVGYVYAEREAARLEKAIFDAAETALAAPLVHADVEALASVAALRNADRSGDGPAAADPARDAGPFLNDKIAWSGYPAGQDGPDGSFDPAWWTELARFDHWDLETGASPLAAARAEDPLADPGRIPLPLFRTFADAAEERLAAAGGEDDPVARLIEVQTLANLLLTTESLAGVRIGLSLHEAVLEARKELSARSQDVGDFLPDLTKAQIDAAKRLSFGLLGFIRLGVPPEVQARVFPPNGPLPFGTCSALTETVPLRHLEREMLEPFYPEAFATLGALVDRLLPRCRAQGLKRYWADRTTTPAALRGELFALASLEDLRYADRPDVRALPPDQGPALWSDLKEWPLPRRWLGLVLTGIGQPTFLKDYLKGS